MQFRSAITNRVIRSDEQLRNDGANGAKLNKVSFRT